jgi:3D (Asp-Asp-Asp) domain-containing protein
MRKKQHSFSNTIIWGVLVLLFAFCSSAFFNNLKQQAEQSSERFLLSFDGAKVKSVNDVAHFSRRSLGIFEVTAYCSCPICCGKYSDGTTASGHKIQIGDKFCAVDSCIPFGKKLDIPNYGFVPVLDRGSAIKGNRIDVYFDTHEEALEWGRQELEIFCLVENE